MKKVYIFSIILLVLCTACESPGVLRKMKVTDKYVYYCSAQEIGVIDDIDKALEINCPVICRDLEFQYPEKITIEVYSDQESYDESLTDKSVIGSPACSGDGKIKLVSPRSPIKVSGIPYKERLLMAVHEFSHLVIDEINNETPIWLDEGLACYHGSTEGYNEISRLILPKVPVISFNELEDSYYDLPAADIYSYSVVKFIVERYGYGKLNRLIRHPIDFEKILSMKKDDFNKEWNEYIQVNYRDNKER